VKACGHGPVETLAHAVALVGCGPGQVHGIAMDDGFTAPELVLDFDTSRI
jgi:hypothetical protein